MTTTTPNRRQAITAALAMLPLYGCCPGGMGPAGSTAAPKQDSVPWSVPIQTVDIDGNPVEIVVYPHPMSDGGYVVNVVTEGDRQRSDGQCWGTVIYPTRK